MQKKVLLEEYKEADYSRNIEIISKPYIKKNMSVEKYVYEL